MSAESTATEKVPPDAQGAALEGLEGDEQGIRYEPATDADRAEITRLFDEQDWHLPPPEVAQVIVARSSSNAIVGLAVIQFVPHIEPWWVGRSDVRVLSLLHRAERFLEEQGAFKAGMFGGIVVTAIDEKQRAAAEAAGFRRAGDTMVKDMTQGKEG